MQIIPDDERKATGIQALIMLGGYLISDIEDINRTLAFIAIVAGVTLIEVACLLRRPKT